MKDLKKVILIAGILILIFGVIVLDVYLRTPKLKIDNSIILEQQDSCKIIIIDGQEYITGNCKKYH